VFVAGLALFSGASLACGLSGSAALLVAARAAQGLGAAVVTPAALAILTAAFPEGGGRNRAVGFWTAAQAGGGASGWIVGGFLTQGLGWEWVFLVTVPIGALGVLLAPILLPESSDPSAPPKLDAAGATTVTAALALLVYGLTRAEEVGPRWALSFGAIVGLWLASSAVRMTMRALNVAYEVEDPAVWKKFPLSILYTVLLAVLVIAAATLRLIGPRLAAWVAELVGLGDVFTTVWTWARIPAGVVLLILVAALIYYLFPNTGEPFRLITPGAVIAVIVWVVVSLAFSWYAANFASYNAVYGSLAGVIVLLLYFFISAAILLLGGELNSEIYHQTIEDEEPEEGAAEDDMEAQ
jgi:membrane protein